MSQLKFAKGGGKAKAPVRTPDSLISNDTVEVLLGISEGPIKGLVDGARSFRADDTPLENASGDANFESFELDLWPGNEAGHLIKLDLGGFSNPINIGTTLAQGTPVTRSGVTKGIDAADFRIVVQQLLEQKDDGVYKANLALRFEIKKKTSSTWSRAWIVDTGNVGSGGGAAGGGGGTGGIGGGNTFDVLNFAAPPIDNGDHETWRSFGRVNDVLTFEGDTQAFATDGPPTEPPVDPTLPAVAVDVDDATGGTVYHWSSGDDSWQPEVPNVTNVNYQTLDDGRRLYNRSDNPPMGARPGDLWIKSRINLIPILTIWNGSAWVLGSEYQKETPPTAVSGEWRVFEKVSGATSKDIRVYLPNAGPDDEWEFRVTKLSSDSTTQI